MAHKKGFAVLEASMTLAVIVVLVLALIAAVHIYLSRDSADAAKGAHRQRLMQITDILFGMPEYACSRCGGSEHERCFDTAKLAVAIPDDTRFGQAKIVISSVYPAQQTWIVHDAAGIGVHESTPVLLCDPFTKAFSYGEVSIDAP